MASQSQSAPPAHGNHTGDVTSVDLATTIAAGAVDVAMLATGTDGELITWDASGNPTTVAVGTATHVLTSNGAGAAPTFQDNPGSSGGTDVAVADGGTGSSTAIAARSALDITSISLFNSTSGVGGAGSTQYFSIGASGAENNVQIPVMRACTIKNLSVHLNTAPGSSETMTITLRKGGSDTSLSVVVSDTNTTGQDNSNTASFTKDDLLSFSAAGSGGANATIVLASVEMLTTG